MPLNMGKILENLASLTVQKPLIKDYIHLAVLSLHMGLYYWSMSFTIWIPLLLFYKPQTGLLLLLFTCWAYYDRNTPRLGGRKSKWFCNLKIFTVLRDYFSTRLIKTADLPKGRNYILAHYPHSIMPFNILPNFLSNFNRVNDIFPGIEMQYLTADILFVTPLLREYCLALGGCSSSESSFKYLLKSTPSKGIIVVPGGASEVQYTKPGSIYTIVRRKGFIRIALATGTSLVPVFTFGETKTWKKVFVITLGNPIKWIVRHWFNSPPVACIPLGRGLLPMKIPVNTVVGAPISVPKAENPSGELIDQYYEIFYQALQDLFEQYKHEYDIAGEKAKLIML